jgi:hypothetical protein
MGNGTQFCVGDAYTDFAEHKLSRIFGEKKGLTPKHQPLFYLAPRPRLEPGIFGLTAL